jgi:FkbM family methyltransferase
MLIDFRQLFPRYNINPKGVLHVGANVGEEAPVYLELGIKKQIWIEANPLTFIKLKQNLLQNPDALAFNECISDVDNKEVVFHISNNSSQSSSILELGTHLVAHPEVNYVDHLPMKAKRLATILRDIQGVSNYDFLNIDLQGAELLALRGLSIYLHQFKAVYLEVNKEELYKGCALVGEIDEYLSHYGFKRVETKWCGNTGWGDAIYIK